MPNKLYEKSINKIPNSKLIVIFKNKKTGGENIEFFSLLFISNVIAVLALIIIASKNRVSNITLTPTLHDI